MPTDFSNLKWSTVDQPFTYAVLYKEGPPRRWWQFWKPRDRAVAYIDIETRPVIGPGITQSNGTCGVCARSPERCKCGMFSGLGGKDFFTVVMPAPKPEPKEERSSWFNPKTLEHARDGGRYNFIHNRPIISNPFNMTTDMGRAWSGGWQEMADIRASYGKDNECKCSRDGEVCVHKNCPQARDNEPKLTGRHCPLDVHGEDHYD